MTDDFRYVDIPENLTEVFGPRDAGTRIYRRKGTDRECREWHEKLAETVGGCVSPGGVAMYVPVSRAAVYKRMKAGKLSAFLFHMTRREKRFFGGEVTAVQRRPYVFIPVSECKAWAEEIEERSASDTANLAKELNWKKRDLKDKFLEHPKPARGEIVDDWHEDQKWD